MCLNCLQSSNGYSANDGSMKTMMTPILVMHSILLIFPIPLFIRQYLLYCAKGFYEILLVKAHYNEKHSFGVHIA